MWKDHGGGGENEKKRNRERYIEREGQREGEGEKEREGEKQSKREGPRERGGISHFINPNFSNFWAGSSCPLIPATYARTGLAEALSLWALTLLAGAHQR